jgi:hypothetical protein
VHSSSANPTGPAKGAEQPRFAAASIDKEVAAVVPPYEHDPFIEPGWRHLRAVRLVAARKKANHPRDDDASKRAWLYYRALQRCTTEARRKILAQRMPAHFEARQFFTSADAHNKAEIEARFLAGQDDAAIATRCSLSVEAVSVYHGLYFDVRGRLDAEAWISTVVYENRIHRCLQEQDRGMIVKLVGYQFGSIVLDALLEYYRQPPLILKAVKRLALHELLALADQLRIQALLLSLTLQNRRRDLRAVALMHDLLARLRVAEENQAHQAPTLRLLDETVFQRLEAADAPLTVENPMAKSGPPLRLEAPMALAG